MSQAVSGGKVCVLCGEDCSGKPRVKDPQGKYMCRACHERAQAVGPPKGAVAAQRTAAVQAAVKGNNADAAFDSLEDNAAFQGLELAQGETQPCTSCGMPIAPAIVVCPSCGFNKETGKGPRKVKVSKEGPGAGAVAGAAASAAATVLIKANPLFWALGGAVGGAVGAAIWAAVAYYLDREIRWIAIGVGVLTGVGVRVAAQSYAGMFSGCIAAAIAIVAVLVGKYAAVSMVVDDIAGGQASGLIQFSDQDAVLSIADDLAKMATEEGKPLDWPSGMTYEDATVKEDYPRSIWQAAEKQWNAADLAWRRDYKAAKEAELRQVIADFKDDVKSIGFESSFGMLDILFFGLAVVTAFSAGAGLEGGD